LRNRLSSCQLGGLHFCRLSKPPPIKIGRSTYEPSTLRAFRVQRWIGGYQETGPVGALSLLAGTSFSNVSFPFAHGLSHPKNIAAPATPQ
jgi:hypothetical protein